MSKRWFQFRLWTLFAAVAVAAYAANWYRLQRQADAAEYARDRMQAGFDAGVEEWPTAIEAYRNWCLAISSVPFADRRAAIRSYLDHIDRLQDSMELEWGMADAIDPWQIVVERRSKIDVYRQEAKQWLAAGKASGGPTIIPIIRSRLENRSEK